MRHMLRVLLIVIIGLIVENGEGMNAVNGIISALPAPPIAPLAPPNQGSPILDFNSIFQAGATVPEMFQPKLYYNPAIRAPDKACVYFTVVNHNAGGAPAPFAPAIVQNVAVGDHNIYFPIDGHQPTTPEAVEYSCANIDNRENSPITDWYMQMFGVVPINNAAIIAAGGIGASGAPVPVYVHAGWDNTAAPAVAQRIMNSTNLVDSQPRRFENIFRIIAANKIGRLLLYRILIEIRRHDAAGNGICEPGIIQLANRNFNRSVTVGWANSFSMSPGHGIVGAFPAANAIIRVNDTIIFTNAVFTRWPALSYHKVDRCCRPSEVGLFHEMVHWFHMLRAPNRSVQECKAYMVARGVVIPPVNLIGSGQQETIGSYFWGGLKNNTRNSIKVSAIPWVEDKEINNVSRQRAKVINFEDIRTILGAPNLAKFRTVVPQPHHMNRYQYLEGDDLSENSFRVSLDMPIRLGHTSMDFYEDYKVVDRALEIAGGSPRNNLLNDQKGLGNLYIRSYNNYVLDGFFAN